MVLHCPALWLDNGFEPSVEDTDIPGLLCAFLSRLADLEVDMVVVCFPLQAADDCIPSLDVTTAAPGSFAGADPLFESFLEGPAPVRTRRAFSRARSSNSISSFSPGEVSVSKDSSTQIKYVVRAELFYYLTFI